MFAFTQKIIKYLEKNLFQDMEEPQFQRPKANSHKQVQSQFKFGQNPNDERGEISEDKKEEVVEDSESTINFVLGEEPLGNRSPTKVKFNFPELVNIQINAELIKIKEQTKDLMKIPLHYETPDKFEPYIHYPTISSAQVSPKSGVMQHKSILKTRSTKTSPKRQRPGNSDFDMSNESVCVQTLPFVQSESGFMTLFDLHQSRRHRLFGKKKKRK